MNAAQEANNFSNSWHHENLQTVLENDFNSIFYALGYMHISQD